jgi:hypothetical protein
MKENKTPLTKDEIEGTLKIAEFLKLKRDNRYFQDAFFYLRVGDALPVDVKNMKFARSFDWLKVVFDFIYEMDDVDTELKDEANLQLDHFTMFAEVTTIFNAVVEFIDWYNANRVTK